MPEVEIKIADLNITASIDDNLIDHIPSNYITKGCLNGVCRVCRCKLVSGQVIENGKIINTPNIFLPCISKPLTDISIESHVGNFSIGSIKSVEYIDNSIIEIKINVKKQFFTSKSIVNIFHNDYSISRSYSLVTMYKDGFNLLRIHVKLKENGIFSNWFMTLKPDDQIKYQIINIPVPRYQKMSKYINIISAGSGMGAALSRGIELSEKHKLDGINIVAINRNNLSTYHENCINDLKHRVNCGVHVRNVHFTDWIHHDIEQFIEKNIFTVSVGSTIITKKVVQLDEKEIESFG
ncbi:hypothetical protein [Vibrio sp. MEBiC08052]|uniref:hypothetical protein n=1 Tax=Vibrio sp. MEBiC08052 TaxID=1761910 RepID=UPI0007405BF7|nr:hypothetical protein [Vibrio sp. MEBiC08052]KUJ00684.1 hypothetical protein VRK_01860 [Vibrio sp. MEBiC08052]